MDPSRPRFLHRFDDPPTEETLKRVRVVRDGRIRCGMRPVAGVDARLPLRRPAIGRTATWTPSRPAMVIRTGLKHGRYWPSFWPQVRLGLEAGLPPDRKSTRLNSSHRT